jgi:hypothetical protein
MANRSYLYSTNKSWVKKRDLSEVPSDIPLFHKILLGVDTERISSHIWIYCEDPVAYLGKFGKGLKKYLNFLSYLEKLPTVDKGLIASYKEITNRFFEQFPDKKSVSFILEPGEIFELTDEPLEEQAQDLFDEIIAISEDIDEILKNKRHNVFETENKKYWISRLQKDLTTIAPNWNEVCYYSLHQA